MVPKFEKYIELARNLIDYPEYPHRHFAFIIEKNKIRAIGWNAKKTHPQALKFGYPWLYVHAELSAITRFEGNPRELAKCICVNVRLNKDGKILQSKPCKSCLRMLAAFRLKEIFYTDDNGVFQEL
jgi:deoxycytidylate deaminase